MSDRFQPRSNPVAGVSVRILTAVFAVYMCASFGSRALAQSPTVSLGFGGAVVADAWNPLQVVSRNADAAVLEIFVDQGSLREGEVPYRYVAELPAGSGLVTFSDDVFLPAWRTLQWRLASADTVVASGAQSARDVDTRPLHLVVSQRPGTWRALYGDDARVLERNGPDLPSRAAAFDGVATVLLDGTTAPPRPEAVLAAAATGATVVVVGTLPPGYADVDLLAASARTAYGNGLVIRADVEGVADALRQRGSLDAPALQGALAERLNLDPPATMATGMILLIGVAYAAVVLLAIRFGRLPGVAASLALAAVASFAAWGAIRPDRTDFRATATLETGAGGVARRATLTSLLTLPAAELELATPGRTLERHVATTRPDGVTIPLPRWGSATLLAPPAVAAQRLAWDGATLVNRSGLTVGDVYVLGMGPQGDLAAGSRLTPRVTEDALLPVAYRGLLALLPQGTALARSGDAVLIAVAEGEPS